MRNYFLLFLTLFSLYACSKKEEPAQPVSLAINRIVSDPDQVLLNSEDMARVNQIIQKNNLNVDNLQFYGLFYPLSDSTDIVYAHQYVNGIRIFSFNMAFVVDTTDSIIKTYGDRVYQVSASAVSVLTENDVLEVFTNELKKDESQYFDEYNPGNSSRYVNMELGYYTLADENMHIDTVTAWYVYMQNFHGEDFPMAFIRDDPKHLIYYFNGHDFQYE